MFLLILKKLKFFTSFKTLGKHMTHEASQNSKKIENRSTLLYILCCTFLLVWASWELKGASLFFKERQERFAHGHSFLKRDESDSIQKSDSEQFATLAHYKNWQCAIRLPCSLKRSNRSDWLFFMSESFFRSKKTNDSLKKPKREFPTLVLFVGRSVCAPTWVFSDSLLDWVWEPKWEAHAH